MIYKILSGHTREHCEFSEIARRRLLLARCAMSAATEWERDDWVSKLVNQERGPTIYKIHWRRRLNINKCQYPSCAHTKNAKKLHNQMMTRYERLLSTRLLASCATLHSPVYPHPTVIRWNCGEKINFFIKQNHSGNLDFCVTWVCNFFVYPIRFHFSWPNPLPQVALGTPHIQYCCSTYTRAHALHFTESHFNCKCPRGWRGGGAFSV